MLRFRKTVNFIRPIRRVETEAQSPFLNDFARYLKVMFPAGIGLYAGIAQNCSKMLSLILCVFKVWFKLFVEQLRVLLSDGSSCWSKYESAI